MWNGARAFLNRLSRYEGKITFLPNFLCVALTHLGYGWSVSGPAVTRLYLALSKNSVLETTPQPDS